MSAILGNLAGKQKRHNPMGAGFARDDGMEDVYIAIMGMTGVGKSSFIEHCTGRRVVIGHGLKSCTMNVEEFTFMYNDTLRVHLIDTPGFDDTDRKDTDVLRDIAGWLGVTYKKKIRLSGMIYLHRITDPRMGGVAKTNLHMFQRLCGPQCLQGIILATTMWDVVNKEDGVMREAELRSTDEFWAYMEKNGSIVCRHTGTKESALNILGVVLSRRHQMVLKIQKQMNEEGLGLEETDAGVKLNQDLIEKEKKHKAELKMLQDEMQEAIAENNQASAAQIAELQREFQAKVNESEKQRQDLKTDMDNLQKEREEELRGIQKKLQEQADRLDEKEKAYKELQDSFKTTKADRTRLDQELKERREAMEKMRDELQASIDALERKKTGFWSEVGDWLEEKVDRVAAWFDRNF